MKYRCNEKKKHLHVHAKNNVLLQNYHIYNNYYYTQFKYICRKAHFYLIKKSLTLE